MAQTLQMTEKPGPLLLPSEWTNPAYNSMPMKVELPSAAMQRSGACQLFEDEELVANGRVPRSPAPALPPSLPLSLHEVEPPTPPPPAADAPLPVISLSLADALAAPALMPGTPACSRSPAMEAVTPKRLSSLADAVASPHACAGFGRLEGDAASLGRLPRSPPPATPPSLSALTSPAAPGSLPISLSAALPPSSPPTVPLSLPVAALLWDEPIMPDNSPQAASPGEVPALASPGGGATTETAKVELARLLPRGAPCDAPLAERGSGQGAPLGQELGSAPRHGHSAAGVECLPNVPPPPGLEPLAGMPHSSVPPSPCKVPSRGSALHGTGHCRPCAWFWKAQGCQNAQECGHCHMCPEGEIKARKKAKRTFGSADSVACKSAVGSAQQDTQASHRTVGRGAVDDCSPITCLSSDKESTAAFSTDRASSSDNGSELGLSIGSEQDTPRSAAYIKIPLEPLMDLPPGLELPPGSAKPKKSKGGRLGSGPARQGPRDVDVLLAKQRGDGGAHDSTSQERLF